MIYVLFGPPGVGKTYIGGLLAAGLGMKFFDADFLFDDELKKMVRSGNFTTEMREVFFDKLRIVTENLLSQLSNNQDLIIAQAFTKEKNRVDFFDYFDKQVKYIYVHAPKRLAHTRMLDRLLNNPHIIDENAFEYAWREFEEPKIDHSDIVNDDLDNGNIIKQFQEINK